MQRIKFFSALRDDRLKAALDFLHSLRRRFVFAQFQLADALRGYAAGPAKLAMLTWCRRRRMRNFLTFIGRLLVYSSYCMYGILHQPCQPRPSTFVRTTPYCVPIASMA